MTVMVSAESRGDALDEVRNRYKKEEIVLYPCDFVDNDFKIVE